MKDEIIPLIRPTANLKNSFIDGLIEFQQEQLTWAANIKVDDLRSDFEKFVQVELNRRTLWTKDVPVEETILWATLENTFVGRISIRHKLNEDLRIMGGHIGYDTRPSFRGRGVANSMLKQAIPIAKDLGLTEALLTCNDDNVPSIRVIEKNGGQLIEKRAQYESGPLKRYYSIKL